MNKSKLVDQLYLKKGSFMQFNGWKRVWLILSIQAFPLIYLVALGSGALDDISNLRFAILAIVLSAIFSATLYALGLAIDLIRDEFKDRAIPSVYKKYIWIPTFFLALIALYYIFSPYQKCYRAVSEASSERGATLQCLRITSW